VNACDYDGSKNSEASKLMIKMTPAFCNPIWKSTKNVCNWSVGLRIELRVVVRIYVTKMSRKYAV